jgi:hypothetical protein
MSEKMRTGSTDNEIRQPESRDRMKNVFVA